MRRYATLTGCTLLALCAMVPRASAVGITIQPVIRELLNLDLSPVDPKSITLWDADRHLGVAEGTPSMIVTVDYYMSISNLAGGQLEQGFGNVVIDLLPANLAIYEGSGGWNPDTSLVDINGELDGGETLIWSENNDYGRSATDLESIIVGLAPRGFGEVGVDPRRTLGQASPAFLGSTYLQWDPAAESSGELDINIEAFSTYGSDLRLRRRPAGARNGGSLSMFVNAGQSGDTDKDGDVDLNDLNNVRNHFDEAGENLVGDTSPYDGVVNLDDLNRVRDNFGATLAVPGSVTAVPEPGSLALAACGAVACLFRVRRRHGA